jgi:hypothetical protein
MMTSEIYAHAKEKKLYMAARSSLLAMINSTFVNYVGKIISIEA